MEVLFIVGSNKTSHTDLGETLFWCCPQIDTTMSVAYMNYGCASQNTKIIGRTGWG